MAFSYMGLLGNGKYIIARSDLLEQYIPFINMFCDVLKGDKSYWFSWNLNSGSGTALLYAYYTLSPFNLLFLILGENYVMTATALVIILKASLAATTFQIFVTRFLKRNGYSSVLFAMMYGLCGYQVCYYFNIMWMDAFYMFPIICLLIVLLIREGKFILLIPAYAYLFATNFYAGYMAGMCSFIFFVFYLLYYRKEGDWHVLLKKVFRFGLSVLLAIGMTAGIWLPAIPILFSGGDGFSLAVENTHCNPLFLYNNFFIGQMQSLHGMTPFVYCGIPSLLLAPFYFLNKKIPFRERKYVFLLILLLSTIMLIPVSNLFMHGMDDAGMFRYRYAYCISFIFCAIGYRQVLYSWKIDIKKVLVLIIFNVIIYGLSWLVYSVVWDAKYNANTLLGLCINIFFMTLWIIPLHLFCKKKQSRTTCYLLMTFMLMVELGVNAGICFNHMDHNALEREEYKFWDDLYSDSVSLLKQSEPGMYRTEYVNIMRKNPCTRYDYCGLQNFASSDVLDWSILLEKLGLYRSTHIIAEAGSTEVTRMLLGVKYIIDGNNIEYTVDGKMYQPYLKNENALNIGFMVSDKILQYASADSPFESQDRILSLMCGENICCYEKTLAHLKVINGIYEDQNTMKVLAQEEGKEPAQFCFSIDQSNNRELYVYFSQLVNRASADSPLIMTPEYATRNNWQAFPMCLNPARIIQAGVGGDGKYEVNILFGEENGIDYFVNGYFCYYNQDELEKAYKILKKNQLEITKYFKTGFEGTVIADKNELLFTSLPYDKGWKLWVDGKKQEIRAVLENAFVGAYLSPGQHEIVLKYEAPGAKTGLYISIICLAGFLVLVLWKQILRKKTGEK